MTLLLLMLVTPFVISGCKDNNDNGTGPDTGATIAATARNSSDFATLYSLLERAGLTVALDGTDNYTVFAPTEDAFAALPSGTLDNLTDAQVEQILKYHVIEGEVTSSDLSASQSAASLLGDNLYIEKDGGNVTVNGTAQVTNADVMATNGVIHAVNQVLLPRGIREANIVDVAATNGSFNTLTQAVADAGLEGVLSYKGPFTVFAPSDDAFNKLPSGTLAGLSPEQLASILTYHVVAGEANAADLSDGDVLETLQGEKLYVSIDNGNVMINGQTMVTQADVSASNGVIHVLDNVLMPDAFGTVVADLQKRPGFSTLVGAVVQANLADALSGDGPFTVFAPDNAAFEKLPSGTLSSLTTSQLSEILQYHVINADIRSMDLGSEQEAETLTGEKVFVTKDEEGNVYVNGTAMVTQADLVASNGVIHAVDNVLLPNKFLDVAGIVSKRYDLGTLTGALQSADLVTTLQGDGPFTVFAPTNAAFDALPAGTLDGLTTQELTDILTYHVLPAKYLSTDLGASQTVATVNGNDVTITVENGTVSINGSATVQIADLEGTNGVVHIIDAVLIPPSN